MRAGQATGDDRLQWQGQGYVVPDSFTAWLFRAARTLVQEGNEGR